MTSPPDDTQPAPTMPDGHCPQCDSRTIKSGANIPGKEGLQGSNRIPLSATMSATLDNYVCIRCGYTESYVHDRDLLTRIANTWQRVIPDSS